MKVLQYPLTQITFFFVFGIVFNRYLNVSVGTSLIAVVFTFAIFVIAFLVNFRSPNKAFKRFFSLITFAFALSVGIFSAVIHNDTNNQNHYTHVINSDDQAVQFKVVLLERWKPTFLNNVYIAQVFEINNKIATGKVLINFRKNKTTKEVRVGSKLALFGKILQIRKPLNPDQFDYGEFLKNKSIYGQVYTDDSAILVFSTADKNLYYYSAIFRNRVIENLKNSGFNSKELAVVHALILGQRQDLDSMLLQNYQYAGVIHILSVSGLHVGFVLIFLTFFLNFLPNTNGFRVFKVLTIIVILWSFALVAGFSPSVVRSVTMFSFVAIGMYMRRKTYIFYTFYCSVFIILLFEPSFLFDVGFQLSYLALFFILWLQPEFAKVYEPNNKIMQHFWDVFTVTIAAQLGTMPLSLYYFHQFPGLFFITNLLIMFLITVIMGVGLVLVLIAFWTVIPTFLAKILENLIRFLNFIVEQIASYESFILKEIPFNFWMMASLFFAVFAFGWFVIKQNFRTTVLFLSSILLFQVSYFSFDWNSKNKNELLILEARYSSLILERAGNEIAVFSNVYDSTTIKQDRNIQSYNVANGTRVKESNEIPNVLFFNGKKLLILDSTSVFVPNLKPDVVLITQSPKINFERFLIEYKPQIVIADASNYNYVVEHVRKTCIQQKIPFHAVAEKGFYRIE